MIYLPVFTIPRAGSNLFMALLHCHPAIYSLTLAAVNMLPEGRELDSTDLDYLPAIYAEGGFAKDLSVVQYIALDKIPPNTKRFGDHLPRLVLMRQAEGILASRQRFAVEYQLDAWRDTPENRERFYETEYDPLQKLAGLSYTTYIEGLVHDVPGIMQGVWNYLRLPACPLLPEVFTEGVSACCQAPFSVVNSDKYASAYWTSKRISLHATPHYTCQKCGTATVGYGGFNPMNRIDPTRMKQRTT